MSNLHAQFLLTDESEVKILKIFTRVFRVTKEI